MTAPTTPTTDHPLLQGLNEPQRQAVLHRDGPCLTLAGPGSGKTAVLVRRCGYLIDVHGVDPAHILAVTFTNKAAREMRERLAKLIGPKRAEKIVAGTFHSLCARWLRKTIHHLGRDPGFTIFDEDDQRKVMREILDRADLDFKPAQVLETISAAKTELWDVREFEQRAIAAQAAGDPWPAIVVPLYDAYQRELRKQNALDFDDLIMLMIEILRTQPGVLAQFQQRFAYVLTDEYQDTNNCLATLLRLIVARHHNIFVVGDDQQSIYLFRQADVTLIRTFQQEYPDARVVKLEQNYRSTKTIVGIAQAIIEPSPENIFNKQLWTANPQGTRALLYEADDEYDEADFVVRTIQTLKRQGHALGEMAIIYRTNVQSRVFEQTFVRAGIPYRLIGGTPFYERKEVKDLLAYLRVLANPKDNISLARIINVPGRGLGERSVGLLVTAARDQDCSLLDVVRAVHATALWQQSTVRAPSLKPAAQRGIGQLGAALDWLAAQAERLDIENLIARLIERLDFAGYLAKEYGREAGADRLANVQELVNVAHGFIHLPQHEQLAAFLEEVALMTDADVVRDDTNACTCITLHRAKGLEYPIVFLPGLEEKTLPHARSMPDEAAVEEERRLFYVGASRAMQRLYLIHARRRTIFGETETRSPSRFLADVPEQHLDWAD